jgi:dihydropteroate synthase-like protein
MADKSKKETVVHIAETQVAAFLTPTQIIKEIHEHFEDRLNDIDLILVPGLIRKDTFLIAEEFGIPCYKASTDAADLAMVLDLVDDLELSQSTPADKLIIEEKKKQALKFIEDFENDTEKRDELLKKENNILVRNLPVGEDFPMRVLSEIASAPILSKEDLIKKAEFFVASGSDMIDIGMIAGEDRSDEIPDLIDTLRPIVGDRPLSIDTLNPKEIEIVKLMNQYPQRLAEAGKIYSPAVIANYAYELSKEFNQYYHDVSILREENASLRSMRLVLVSKIAELLTKAMNILGIVLPERM